MEFTLTRDEQDRSQPVRTGGKDLKSFRSEMNECYKVMKSFNMMEPGDIFKTLAGFTARFSEVRSWTVRSDSKTWRSFRTQEIDPFIQECERQFKYWSRFLSDRTLDWDMAKGG